MKFKEKRILTSLFIPMSLFLLFFIPILLAARPPLFELKDLDGKSFQLSSELGKSVIILDFWATWCKPCLRELPLINEMYQKNKDKGLKVYAISIDDPSTVALVKPTVKKYGFTMPVLLDTDSSVVRKFNPSKNVPYMCIIGADGEVIREFTGYKPGDEKIVDELIAEQLKKLTPMLNDTLKDKPTDEKSGN